MAEPKSYWDYTPSQNRAPRAKPKNTDPQWMQHSQYYKYARNQADLEIKPQIRSAWDEYRATARESRIAKRDTATSYSEATAQIAEADKDTRSRVASNYARAGMYGNSTSYGGATGDITKETVKAGASALASRDSTLAAIAAQISGAKAKARTATSGLMAARMAMIQKIIEAQRLARGGTELFKRVNALEAAAKARR